MLNTKLTKSTLHTTDKYIQALKKAWILTVWNMLNHFPRDYEDRTDVLDSFSMINIKEKNTILVKLLSINNQKTANNKILTKWILEDKNGFLSEAVWFNRKYLSTQLKTSEKKKVIICWKVKYAFWKITFQSPDVETDLSKISWEIVPMYSEINYIPSKWIQTKMQLLKSFISSHFKPLPNPPLSGEGVEQWNKTDEEEQKKSKIKKEKDIDYLKNMDGNLPEHIVKKYNFISKKEAIYKIHFPKNKNDIELAKSRLAYEELFEINYKAIKEKHKNFQNSEGRSISIKLNPKLIKDIISNLWFILTDQQKITLFQILKDMEKNHSMQRLLEWDVWTGKTIVVLIASIHTILESKTQVAIMVPTEILATQHFNSIQNLLKKYNISSHLLTWSTKTKQKNLIKEDIKNGNIDIIIWTHALLQNDVIFNNLWLVIIDEQHRFGVKQREILESCFDNISWIVPHSLNMTATPIPRTLALTLYWDQDLSVISQYPKWRKEIFTRVAKNNNDRLNIELFIQNELKKGRQIFWISPLVEESEKIDLANAINTYESLIDIFSWFNVWLLHGRMKPKEKEQIMQEFKENKINILSSTSVIEVWIDIPNATIMCIEWAERFGLSQLHQFRWRVWRWEYKSYCYLFPSKWNYTDRLRAMERTNNGFELAEIDLEIRGPWEVYGVRQSGIPDLKIASITDLALISQIREDIEEMF